LTAIEGELRETYYRSLIGRNLRVLLEARTSTTAGHVVGTSCRYATVELPGGARVGQLVNVVARELLPGPRIGALLI
jgi:tRNA A37 methylthiotransferase MiaB